MHYAAPKKIIPLYSMVSFTEIPYSEAMRRWRKQMKLVNFGIGLGAAATLAAVTTAAAWAYNRFRR